MNDPLAVIEAPSTAEIRAALDRVLASPPFSGSPQLIAFLRFVVDSTLKGDAERIKSYTIAVEALGRSENFDPQTDPIVRVEAGRLRRALQHYYAGQGNGDPVIIDLPLGGYIPTFRRRANDRDAPNLAAIWQRRLAAEPLAWLAAALIVGVLAVGAFVADRQAITPEPGVTGTASRFSPSNGVSAATQAYSLGVPVVVVERINAVAVPREQAILLDTLSDKLRDALSRFDEIEVVSDLAWPASSQPGSSNYRVAFTAEYNKGDMVDLSVRLQDSSKGIVVWAQVFEDISIAVGSDAANEVVRKVATALAQPYGVIYAREITKLATNNVDPRYRCVMETFEYWRGFDRTKTSAVRACLERVTALDPNFSQGFALLGLVNLREYYEPENVPATTVDTGLLAAQRAVELKPQSARAHHAMMGALFARGDIAAALAEGEKAVSLNPNDMLILQAYGIRLIADGHLEKGTSLLRQVAIASPVRTPKFEFSLFLSEYMLGRDEKAAPSHPRLFTTADDPLLLVARAVTAVRAGAHADARQAMNRLVALHPAWRDNPRRQLEKYIPASVIVDRLAQDLALVAPASMAPDR